MAVVRQLSLVAAAGQQSAAAELRQQQKHLKRTAATTGRGAGPPAQRLPAQSAQTAHLLSSRRKLNCVTRRAPLPPPQQRTQAPLLHSHKQRAQSSTAATSLSPAKQRPLQAAANAPLEGAKGGGEGCWRSVAAPPFAAANRLKAQITTQAAAASQSRRSRLVNVVATACKKSQATQRQSATGCGGGVSSSANSRIRQGALFARRHANCATRSAAEREADALVAPVCKRHVTANVSTSAAAAKQSPCLKSQVWPATAAAGRVLAPNCKRVQRKQVTINAANKSERLSSLASSTSSLSLASAKTSGRATVKRPRAAPSSPSQMLSGATKCVATCGSLCASASSSCLSTASSSSAASYAANLIGGAGVGGGGGRAHEAGRCGRPVGTRSATRTLSQPPPSRGSVAAQNQRPRAEQQQSRAAETDAILPPADANIIRQTTGLLVSTDNHQHSNQFPPLLLSAAAAAGAIETRQPSEAISAAERQLGGGATAPLANTLAGDKIIAASKLSPPFKLPIVAAPLDERAKQEGQEEAAAAERENRPLHGEAGGEHVCLSRFAANLRDQPEEVKMISESQHNSDELVQHNDKLQITDSAFCIGQTICGAQLDQSASQKMAPQEVAVGPPKPLGLLQPIQNNLERHNFTTATQFTSNNNRLDELIALRDDKRLDDLLAGTAKSLRKFDMPIKLEPICDYYDLETRPFARGKFAQVKKCVHKKTRQSFAAKCIKKRRRLVDIRHEILLEIEALKLSYETEHIVKLFEVYETQTEIILVLEMANGGELQRVLDDEETIDESLVRKMIMQILEGLIHLHENQIVHLDIKPQNLLLTKPFPFGDVKLCDFGISRRITKEEEIREICGTPDYVAPEILRYDPISLATDMWSLGVLTYVLLSGYSPFGSESKQATYCNITQANLEFPSEIFDKISANAIDFIQKLIIREPTERLTSREAREHKWLRTE